MSTADKAEKQAGHGAAWANLIVCGGISWAVSLWHATHATTSGNKFLAVLAATAPVVTAAFASHHVAKKGVKLGKRIMTCIVFVMGMALSVKAQAQSIGPIVGGVELGVVFALMLDVSTFLALSSIMSKPAAETNSEAPESAPATPPVSAPAAAPTGAPVRAPVAPPAERLPERLPVTGQAPMESPAGPPVKAPAARPKKPRKAPAAKTKMTPAEVKATAWKLLKENPEMSAPELAVKLGKAPKSGHVRDLKREILEQMRDAGELPSVRSIGA